MEGNNNSRGRRASSPSSEGRPQVEAPITDGMRWRFMIENDRNVIGFMHMLRLLLDGKGDKTAFVKMTDRVIRSAQGANATEVINDDLLEALKELADEATGIGQHISCQAGMQAARFGETIERARAAIGKASAPQASAQAKPSEPKSSEI